MRHSDPPNAAGAAERDLTGMAHGPDLTTIGEHWGRDGLGQRILDALAAAGKDLRIPDRRRHRPRRPLPRRREAGDRPAGAARRPARGDPRA